MNRVPMKQGEPDKIRQAIQATFWSGVATTVLAAPGAFAQDPDAPAPAPAPTTGEAATELETIEVTGSRIRRVDMETASPIFTIDRSMIQASGVTTVGELVQELPSIRGNAINPQVNNGGGDGAAEISLRGLGEDRTLVLLNGRRMVTQDVNAIPINFIERVDVLNEGASAVYGSDAVAGVVNFITRKDYGGAEAAYDYGMTSHKDGERQSLSVSMGTSTGRSNLMVGLNYNKQDKIGAADRSFASNALYLYGGTVYSFGSSRTPNGRIFLPSAQFEDDEYDCIPAGDPIPAEISVSRNAGAVGDAVSDYHCFGGSDFYNYQPLNLVLTPQERAGLFTSGNFQINDALEAYTEAFYNRTQSGFQIAPLPFDARNDQVLLSANSVYNPFGIDLGGDGALGNPQFLTRLEALGNRRNKIETNTSQVNLGLRGDLFDTGWRWDVAGTYGHISQKVFTSGYLYQPALAAALGPSFDADPAPGIQDPRCGTPGNEIDGCIPVNFFNLSDPASRPALDAITASYSNSATQTSRGIGVSFTGDMFTLPAGNIATAVGVEYRAERLSSTTDFVATALPPDFLNCYLSQETCSSATNGDYNVTELYGEVLVPIITDRPEWGAEALNAIVGLRHSDYSNFGTTTNGKIGLEYRPIDDLLARISYSEVFRAPTIADLYAPPASNAPTFNDPCTGITTAVGVDPNLDLTCENVARDGTYAPENAQITGLLQGNPQLDPETGEVLTWGFVYDPSWLDGFSTQVDFWKYELEDTIEALDVNTIATQCLATGDPTFCGYISRFGNGQVNVINQPTANLGAVEAQGVDVGFKYTFEGLPGLRNLQTGRFRLSLDTSYVDKFDRTADQNFPNQVTGLAGTFDRQDGNFSRLKGKVGVQWNMAAYEALWLVDYIGPFDIEDPDGSPGTQPTKSYDSHTYHDITFGYNLPVFTTKLQIGINNVFDETPPILFQNNVINSNTDVETFDTIGPFVWARVTKNF